MSFVKNVTCQFLLKELYSLDIFVTFVLLKKHHKVDLSNDPKCVR